MKKRREGEGGEEMEGKRSWMGRGGEEEGREHWGNGTA